MLKRRTQNVYSNDNIGKKGSVVSLQKGYDAFNSFEGLKQPNKPSNKGS
jgi:hypothetical protein